LPQDRGTVTQLSLFPHVASWRFLLRNKLTGVTTDALTCSFLQCVLCYLSWALRVDIWYF